MSSSKRELNFTQIECCVCCQRIGLLLFENLCHYFDLSLNFIQNIKRVQQIYIITISDQTLKNVYY